MSNLRCFDIGIYLQNCQHTQDNKHSHHPPKKSLGSPSPTPVPALLSMQLLTCFLSLQTTVFVSSRMLYKWRSCTMILTLSVIIQYLSTQPLLLMTIVTCLSLQWSPQPFPKGRAWLPSRILNKRERRSHWGQVSEGECQCLTKEKEQGTHWLFLWNQN